MTRCVLLPVSFTIGGQACCDFHIHTNNNVNSKKTMGFIVTRTMNFVGARVLSDLYFLQGASC